MNTAKYSHLPTMPKKKKKVPLNTKNLMPIAVSWYPAFIIAKRL